MWSAPFQVLLSLFFLFQLLGISVLAGLICLVAFIPINAKLSLAMRKYQVFFQFLTNILIFSKNK